MITKVEFPSMHPDIKRLDQLCGLFSDALEVVKDMSAEEYDRVRSYLNSRFSIGMPYEHPHIKKEKK